MVRVAVDLDQPGVVRMQPLQKPRDRRLPRPRPPHHPQCRPLRDLERDVAQGRLQGAFVLEAHTLELDMASVVPSLVLLNGPPGIGKSTLSELYADRHPGTLNLDVDLLHQLVGGWQQAPHHAHDVLRPVALAMASTYLAGGSDVVVPQYLAKVGEIERFERVANERGAHFHEVVLLDEKAATIARFDAREDDSAWGQHNRRAVAAQGGPAFLAAMYDRLMEVVPLRRRAVVVRTEPGSVETTYALLINALSRLQFEDR